jgi:uncharacterized protein YdeI (BOF family)
VPQFLPTYTGDPAMEVVTNVSSDLLNFADAKLTYTSDNTNVVYFEGNVMHCGATGTATVTVSCTFGGESYSENVVINVEKNADVTFGTVQNAIDAELGQTVVIKGIVRPSLVNQDGFYLIDETGVIAVQTDAETMATLQIGHEVILEAVRHINTKGGTNYYGQTCLNDAKVVANAYGKHEYSTATFVTDKTLKQVYDLNPMTDYTTTVFVLKATVTVEEAQYYTNIYLTDGNGTQLRLYSSSAKQYNWLKAYAGQEITVEVAACNWNDKNYYTGCVLAVITNDGKVCNELNFTK